MDAKTGAILGYGSHPTFSANDMEITDYNDYCAMLPYEPGSTMKSFVYAATINEGTFNRNDTFDCSIFYVTTDANGKIARSPYRVMENQEIRNYRGAQPYYPTFMRLSVFPIMSAVLYCWKSTSTRKYTWIIWINSSSISR